MEEVATTGTVFNVAPEQWEATMALAGGWPSEAARPPGRIGRPYADVGRVPPSLQRDPFEVDPDKVDRGLQAHATTQDALAQFLRGLGIEPRSPIAGEPEFDLAWEADATVFVAEVKSIAPGNEEKQLRLGLGEVLRYRQKLSDAGRRVVAVLAPECEPADASWKALCRELGVVVAWPGAFDVLARPRP